MPRRSLHTNMEILRKYQNPWASKPENVLTLWTVDAASSKFSTWLMILQPWKMLIFLKQVLRRSLATSQIYHNSGGYFFLESLILRDFHGICWSAFPRFSIWIIVQMMIINFIRSFASRHFLQAEINKGR